MYKPAPFEGAWLKSWQRKVKGQRKGPKVKAAKMPYVLISTQVRLVNFKTGGWTQWHLIYCEGVCVCPSKTLAQETGTTQCGDEHSDPELMKKLDAALEHDSGKKL